MANDDNTKAIIEAIAGGATTLAMWLSHSQGLCLRCLSDHSSTMQHVLFDMDNLETSPVPNETAYETARLIGTFVDRVNELEEDTNLFPIERYPRCRFHQESGS